MAQANQNGNSTFENRVAWARFYLAKAGWMYAPKRGVWALTELGEMSPPLSSEDIIALRKRVQAQAKSVEDEQDVPQALEGVQYWFVGAVWGQVDDQLPRFLQEGIWQNGYDDKFVAQVQAMQPGDRIAIKSSFVRKHGLPFDNKGLSVSGMRIKVVGTVVRNHGDGRTVDVKWEALGAPREWYFYTYRVTVTRARVEDEVLARLLVAFVFEGAAQDYEFFMRQPYWRDRFATPPVPLLPQEEGEEETSDDDAGGIEAFDVYGVQDIAAEGGFIPPQQLSDILERWRAKKNLILQGPPGTGKTWLAKRLAQALIGQRQVPDEQLRMVQFHPAMSYEDFVRGYRPNADGRLTLTDGVFLQVVEAARYNPEVKHVLVIEEINRGNPAQVLGEVLTLMEASKRNSESAMELAYPRTSGERVYVPDNLYVIGTMNVADRSLALVDLALRRRFAFVSLEPVLNAQWRSWCEVRGLDAAVLDHISTRMQALNAEIAADRALGPQFQVGHSYVTPPKEEVVGDGMAWFADVVETEVGPLLHEYWFDTPERADRAIAQLLASGG